MEKLDVPCGQYLIQGARTMLYPVEDKAVLLTASQLGRLSDKQRRNVQGSQRRPVLGEAEVLHRAWTEAIPTLPLVGRE